MNKYIVRVTAANSTFLGEIVLNMHVIIEHFMDALMKLNLSYLC